MPISLGSRSNSTIEISTYSNLSRLPMISCDAEDIQFTSGNPSVEQTEGTIHIYKKVMKKDYVNECQTSTMLCLLGIPSSITVKDLLIFCSPMRDGISEMKIVKGSHVGYYMALVNLKSQDYADQFYSVLNGVPYNSFETDICQLAYISHVEAIPFSQGASFPLRGLVELPSCPVCLEKLDEPVQGILTTILCNHNFHDECISQTTETTCPVCRYVQSPELVGDSQCADCDLRENLWICLICGHLGCGRYGQKHAHRHFQETGHTFALELGKNMVWDYADDAYVHRLAVNQDDGKLVQVGEGSDTGDKKMDYLNLEFSAILVSQLESQRQYFEAQLENITISSASRASDLEIALSKVVKESNSRIDDLKSKLDKALKSLATLESKVSTLNKEKTSLSKKLTEATAHIQRLQSSLDEERSLTSSLSSSQALWQERALKAEVGVREAQEEMNELLLNFDLRDKLVELGQKSEISTAELATADMVLTEPTPAKGRRRKKRQ